ncbi:hypothetical protein HIM_09677 [Hirsutella minnesotensis 3608]|uniref:Uncharacterized protein n=1 Tax=Hirsutella minnesotensis 3608 TaxID=1043627 RepID=A0A0F7ZGI0_9HYPO|nr:hypothetical protein HIM_09677 [Hirsutella minnesotensis 3608]
MSDDSSKLEKHKTGCSCSACVPLLEAIRSFHAVNLQQGSRESSQQAKTIPGEPRIPSTGYEKPTGARPSNRQDDYLFQIYTTAARKSVSGGLQLYPKKLKTAILESQSCRIDSGPQTSRSALCYYRDNRNHNAWLRRLNARLPPDAGIGKAAYSQSNSKLNIFIDNPLLAGAACFGLSATGSSTRLHCALAICAMQWADYVFADDSFGEATAEIFQPLTPFLLWWADHGWEDRTGDVLKLCVAISIEDVEKRTTTVAPTVPETLSARTYDAGIPSFLAMYDGANSCGCADLPAVDGAAFSAVLNDYFDLLSDIRHCVTQNSILNCVSAGIEPWVMHKYVMTGCLWSLITPTCSGYFYMSWFVAHVLCRRWRGDMVRLNHLAPTSTAWCNAQEAAHLQTVLRAPKLPSDLIDVPWHIAVARALREPSSFDSQCRILSTWASLRKEIQSNMEGWDGSISSEATPDVSQGRAFIDAFHSGRDDVCETAQATSICIALRSGWLQSGSIMGEFVKLLPGKDEGVL